MGTKNWTTATGVRPSSFRSKYRLRSIPRTGQSYCGHTPTNDIDRECIARAEAKRERIRQRNLRLVASGGYAK